MNIPDDDRLHAYVDGRLDAGAQAEVEAWLRAHPSEAARVSQWRRDAAALRTAWAWTDAMPPPGNLDPARIRRKRSARHRARLGSVAACVLTLGLGGWGGWRWRDVQLHVERPPMADAIAAYRLFAATDTALEFGGSEQGRLGDWLHRHFGDSGTMPDLRAQGFELRGGRMLSTPEGAAAMLVYANAEGERVALYLRPRNPHMHSGERRDGGLLAQYWSHGATSLALVGPAGGEQWRTAAPALRENSATWR